MNLNVDKTDKVQNGTVVYV